MLPFTHELLVGPFRNDGQLAVELLLGGRPPG